ncbi:hypothetical protein ACH518_14040 [Methylomonas sp. HW2-6]|uniref:hypothetical protein n=1 Tax=Methylomonas sp. HW2-6 TaxID=3376687 RepID=UPI0040420121
MLLGANVKLRLIDAALQTDCADNAETVRDKLQASYLIRQRAALREGDVVYSLNKTHAIVDLAPAGPSALPVRHQPCDGYFYMNPAAIEPLRLPANLRKNTASELNPARASLPANRADRQPLSVTIDAF